MENYYNLFLIPHIIGGFLSLFVAPIAMIVKKGGKAHRRWGKIYFWSMTIVTATSLVMSVMKPNLFLAMVGVFSFYLVASGYRALYRRNVNSLNDVALIDWLLLGVSGMFGLAMFGLGTWLLWKNLSGPFGYVCSVFGFISIRSVFNDFVSFTKPGHHKDNWIYHHMGGMIGAYIATVTAFSVVNFSFLPGIVGWLWPAAMGVPLIFYWIGKYKKRKKIAVSRVAAA